MSQVDSKRKEGYYLVIIAGGGGEAIVYFDGESYLAHGSADPIDTTLFLYISTEPLDFVSITNVTYESF